MIEDEPAGTCLCARLLREVDGVRKEKERLTAASRIHLLLIAKDEESAKVTRNDRNR